jgi:3-oxoacyl-[acyl-carrier protein] reductase
VLSLAGRRALISGGSRGIGRAIAARLARLGARVAIGYTADEQAAALALTEIRRADPGASAHRADLADDAQARSLVENAVAGLGGLDVVVANHGIWKRAPLAEATPDQWDETLDVNLRGAWSLARHARPHLGRGACLVFVASTAGQRGEAEYAAYAASKGGLIALTRSLAQELAPRGVRVNGVAPGWIMSDMTRAALEGPAGPPALRRIPAGRFGAPEDVAAAVAFLVSDAASYVWGEVLSVNGGAVMAG